MDQLTTRITKLNQDFTDEKTAILNQIDEKGQELARMLNEFKVIMTLVHETMLCCMIMLVFVAVNV